MSISPRSMIAVFTTLVFGAVLAGCGQDEDQGSASKASVIRPVKTITLKPTVSKLERTYSAVVLPSQEVELSFRVSGKIVELPIRSGTGVEKGDVIAQLDTRDFKAEIIRLESQLEQAKAQMETLKSGARAEDIAVLKADVAAAQAKTDEAKAQVGRTKQLFDEGIVAQARMDKELTAQRVAQASLNAKKQALLKGQSGARKEDLDAQSAVIRGLTSQMGTLNDTLSDATLRAPFDGMIATRKVDNFTNIKADETIATLQKLSLLDLTFNVPGPDVTKLAKNRNLNSKVTLDALPNQVFDAKLSEFSTQADPATQTYQGRVTIQNLGDEVILPGMTGSVIVTAKHEGAVLFMLPLSAIASKANGQPFVWLINRKDNTTTRHNVMTGEASGADIIISNGLKEGDLVVTAGLSALQEKMVVKPISAIGE